KEEQKEQEKLEKQRLKEEQQRLKEAQKEQEKLERQILKEEEKEQEKLEKQRLKEEQQRLKEEQKEQEKLERQRLKEEQQRLKEAQKEQEKLERQRLKEEQQRLKEAQKEQEKLERQRLKEEEKEQFKSLLLINFKDQYNLEGVVGMSQKNRFRFKVQVSGQEVGLTRIGNTFNINGNPFKNTVSYNTILSTVYGQNEVDACIKLGEEKKKAEEERKAILLKKKRAETIRLRNERKRIENLKLNEEKVGCDKIQQEQREQEKRKRAETNRRYKEKMRIENENIKSELLKCFKNDYSAEKMVGLGSVEKREFKVEVGGKRMGLAKVSRYLEIQSSPLESVNAYHKLLAMIYGEDEVNTYIKLEEEKKKKEAERKAKQKQEERKQLEEEKKKKKKEIRKQLEEEKRQRELLKQQEKEKKLEQQKMKSKLSHEFKIKYDIKDLISNIPDDNSDIYVQMHGHRYGLIQISESLDLLGSPIENFNNYFDFLENIYGKKELFFQLDNTDMYHLKYIKSVIADTVKNTYGLGELLIRSLDNNLDLDIVLYGVNFTGTKIISMILGEKETPTTNDNFYKTLANIYNYNESDVRQIESDIKKTGKIERNKVLNKINQIEILNTLRESYSLEQYLNMIYTDRSNIKINYKGKDRELYYFTRLLDISSSPTISNHSYRELIVKIYGENKVKNIFNNPQLIYNNTSKKLDIYDALDLESTRDGLIYHNSIHKDTPGFKLLLTKLSHKYFNFLYKNLDFKQENIYCSDTFLDFYKKITSEDLGYITNINEVLSKTNLDIEKIRDILIFKPECIQMRLVKTLGINKKVYTLDIDKISELDINAV
ncbi:MAG: hypothetical protein GY828_06350, partial [Candidatus Gracilibacteria bacterium]|nr:hypothetical protein [Candidatus Gracilibacteria bacterium]